jgi:enamine deaminase RidA (YjgF/YER057c/UK114 family)
MMGHIEERLAYLGLVLPPEVQPPPGVVLPFAFVNIRGDRAVVSGHSAQASNGSLAPPFGQVGGEISLDEAVGSARLAALSMLGSLQRELGTLDRVAGWLRVFGMVNSARGFEQQPVVINGFSNLILDVFGPDVGRHARSAVGMASLPFGIPVEVEAEVLIR